MSRTKYKFDCKYANGIVMTVGDGSQVKDGTTWTGEKGWIHVNRGVLEASDEKILKEVIGPDEIKLYESNDHKQNFIECIKSRKPTICPEEVGFRSISVGLLGEIAMLTGRKIKWNPRERRNSPVTRRRRRCWGEAIASRGRFKPKGGKSVKGEKSEKGIGADSFTDRRMK